MLRTGKFALGVAVMSLPLAGISSFCAPPAKAHSWYPRSCCNGYDCSPIKSLQRLPDGSMIITNENGDTATFPAGFEINIPEDGRRHACISPYSKRSICLYLPAEI